MDKHDQSTNWLHKIIQSTTKLPYSTIVRDSLDPRDKCSLIIHYTFRPITLHDSSLSGRDSPGPPRQEPGRRRGQRRSDRFTTERSEQAPIVQRLSLTWTPRRD